MTGHGYVGNIDPAFPGKSLCDRIWSDLNFRKILFPDYTGIPIPLPTNARKSRSKKFS